MYRFGELEDKTIRNLYLLACNTASDYVVNTDSKFGLQLIGVTNVCCIFLNTFQEIEVVYGHDGIAKTLFGEDVEEECPDGYYSYTVNTVDDSLVSESEKNRGIVKYWRQGESEISCSDVYPNDVASLGDMIQFIYDPIFDYVLGGE